MRIYILVVLLAVFGQALEKYQINPDSITDGKFMGIKILDSRLVDISRVDGEKFYGISGISYDEKHDVLYALNDRVLFLLGFTGYDLPDMIWEQTDKGINMAWHRKILRNIFDAALKAVAPDRAVDSHVRLEKGILHVANTSYRLTDIGHIIVVGAGKGAAPMVAALENILGPHIYTGLVCVKYGHSLPTLRVALEEAAHPVPDARGETVAKKMVALARSAGPKDLIICVLTGGASALTPAFVEGITLEQGQAMTQLLLESGATIDEINTIRKHLSCFGGGNLARAAMPATLVSLIVSDVVGDPLDVIASGPTTPDPSTYCDCLKILMEHKVNTLVSPDVQAHLTAVQAHLEKGSKGKIPETPSPGDPAFDRVQNVLVATNAQALTAAANAARSHGYHPRILTSRMTGVAREKARELVLLARDAYHNLDRTGPVCLLAGGETIVKVNGSGLGGRNQEMALAAAMELVLDEDIFILCAGTDGTDGPTDAAGGFACPGTLKAIQEKKLRPHDFLANNDAYHFLDQADSLVKTGPTRTNVMDIVVILVGTPKRK